MRKPVLYVLIFAFVHVVVTVLLTVMTFGAVMQGFDGGEVASPRVVSVLMAAGDVLSWPLRYVVRPRMSSAMQYAVLYANGLLWASAALAVYRHLRRLRPRGVAPTP